MKKTLFIIVCHFFFVSLISCATIPKETVLLSQKIGVDLRKVHQAYRKTVQIHFKILREQMNFAIDKVFIPEYIENKQGSLLTAAMHTNENNRKALTLRWATRTVKTIEEKRREKLRPINELEIETLEKVDQAFNNLYNANNALTSHLISIRKVKETQVGIIKTIGLNGINYKVNDFLIDASKKTEKAIDALDKL